MSDNSTKVTNLDYLTELAKGNRQFIAEMIDVFLAESPKEIILIEQSISEQNLAVVKACAHKMRSTIPFVGLNKIIEKEVIDMEHLAAVQQDDPVTFSTNLQQIETLFIKVKEVYEQAIQELGDEREKRIKNGE